MAVEDLSHLTNGLLGDSSMQATNTVSEKPDFASPGTPSESSDGIPVGTVHDPVDAPASGNVGHVHNGRQV